jgi:hypothetical protein
MKLFTFHRHLGPSLEIPKHPREDLQGAQLIGDLPTSADRAGGSRSLLEGLHVRGEARADLLLLALQVKAAGDEETSVVEVAADIGKKISPLTA